MAPSQAGDGGHDAASGRRMRPEDVGIGRVFDLVAEAVIVGDVASGRVLLWNDGASRIFGRSADDAVGMLIEDLIPASLREAHRTGLARFRQLGAGTLVDQQRTVELPALGPGGAEVWVELSLTSLPAPAPPGLVLAIARDASARRDVQRALAKLAERDRLRVGVERDRHYRLLFESNPDPMWFYGVESLAILEVNDAALREYRYSREEFLAMTIADLRPPEDIPAMRESVANSPVQDRSGPWRHVRKDGTLLLVEITSHAITFRGERARFVVARDVSERERLQSQLRQSQRLESLGRLAGGVAHDFNNLLAVMLGYAAFVTEEIADSRAGRDRLDEAQRDAEQIGLAAEKAADLTRQLLAFARRDVVQRHVVNLNDVVTDIETLLRRTIDEQITLVSSLAPDLHPILAERGQLEQVLVNLAVNARDAMPEGGTLAIDTVNIDVDADYAGQHPGVITGPHVRLRISDTGMGMSRDVLDRAFDPFFTTKEAGEGSGLGLATVYGIITQAGGHPQLYSEPGVGTTFSALLPATSEVTSMGDSAPAASTQAGDETILVVEDEDALREVTRRILQRHGYHVLTAADGSEALELASSHAASIDLVISDAVMPRMPGREVVRRLRQMRPSLRVIFMSGYAAPVLSGTVLLDADVRLIEKPFTAAGLAATVREVLDQSR
jgi:PAS domain S-box-containing protein